MFKKQQGSPCGWSRRSKEKGSVLGNEVRKVMEWGQIMWSHGKDLGVDSECNGKLLEGFDLS